MSQNDEDLIVVLARIVLRCDALLRIGAGAGVDDDAHVTQHRALALLVLHRLARGDAE